MTETFDHEKLDVYRLQLGFVRWSSDLLEQLAEGGASTREARDHLNRAALSVLLNVAEGNGKRQRRVRAKFFDDARGSATECAACLDALVAIGACAQQRVHEGKETLLHVVAMLAKLVLRFSDTRVREEDGDCLAADHEDEDEHEHDGGHDEEDDDEDDPARESTRITQWSPDLE